jgi:hypothetical protein
LTEKEYIFIKPKKSNEAKYEKLYDASNFCYNNNDLEGFVFSTDTLFCTNPMLKNDKSKK